jgi:hypothetical protein
MSKFTDAGENKVADFWRAQGSAWLPTNWTVIPGSAGSDGGVTEITGLGIAPALVARSLAAWESTQGDTLASSGTSKSTRNAAAISFGTPTGSGTLTHVGLKDATAVLAWVPVTNIAFVAGDPDPVQIAAGGLEFTLDDADGRLTHYHANKFIDLFFRGQTFTWPATLYLSAFTAAPTAVAGSGTEVAGGSYARIALIPSLTSLSGTQSAGSTTASSGNGGRISNNATLSHPSPTANWGDVVAVGVHDAATLGNLLWWQLLDDPITVNSGGPPLTYAPDARGFTVA